MFTIVADLCIALWWALPLVALASIFILRYPLTRVRIFATRDEVYLQGVDPRTMRGFLLGGVFLSALFFQFIGVAAGTLSTSLSMLATLGCHVDLRVTRRGSRVTRQIFGFLSWNVWHSSEAASLDWDDYNDLLVPDALRICLGLGSLEIAWLARGSGKRTVLLTDEFNAAVSSLRDTALRDAMGDAAYRSQS